MDEDNTLLKAGRRSGWLNIRPCLESGRFIRCADEEWAQGLLEGSHRMQRDWIEDRMAWLGEDGMPRPTSGEDWDNNFEEEQTYLRNEGQERMLENVRDLEVHAAG